MEEESLEDPIRVLPPEVALEIFSYLTAEELLVIRQVNSLWNRLVNSECLWRRLCEEKDILDYTPTIACKLYVRQNCRGTSSILDYMVSLETGGVLSHNYYLKLEKVVS